MVMSCKGLAEEACLQRGLTSCGTPCGGCPCTDAPGMHCIGAIVANRGWPASAQPWIPKHCRHPSRGTYGWMLFSTSLSAEAGPDQESSLCALPCLTTQAAEHAACDDSPSLPGPTAPR